MTIWIRRSPILALALASALLATPALATEAEDFENALDQVAGDAFPGKLTKKKGLCVCNDGGVNDGLAGNLVSFPEAGSTGFFQVGCGVRRFDAGGEQDSSSFCFPYLSVGR